MSNTMKLINWLGTIVLVSIGLFTYPQDVMNLKVPVFIILSISFLWGAYRQGYSTGKRYYTEHNDFLPIRSSKHWNHHLTFRDLVSQHPFCLMEWEHAPCQEHDYPLPSGVVHLLFEGNHYVTIKFVDDGWVYVGNTLIGKDRMNGKYIPLMTVEAMRISQDKHWELLF